MEQKKNVYALAIVFMGVLFAQTMMTSLAFADTLIDDFEDGDTTDWGYFGGNNAGGGFGPASDRPHDGSYYLNTGWAGDGTNSGFYGGLFKNLDNAAQVPLPIDPWFSVWVLNQSDATVDQFTLELTIREDLDGNGWTAGQEDSFRLDTIFNSTQFDDQWTRISAPVSGFTSLNTGGDGSFNGDLDEIVIVISGVQDVSYSTVQVDFDQLVFTSGNPTPLLAAFQETNYSVNEGETAVLTVMLNRPHTTTVTVDYATAESNARVDRQYTPVSGMLTFPIGETVKTIEIPTFADGKHTRDRRVVVNLYEGSALLDVQRRTVVTIIDSDPANTRLIDDYEGYQPYNNLMGSLDLSSKTIMDTEGTAVPSQLSFEDVLSVDFDTTSNPASFHRNFSHGQDWRSLGAISFWYYGSNNGETTTMQIKDNMTMTTGTVDPVEWVMVWSDEFNDPVGTPPNPNVWQYELGDGALNNIKGWGNEESQYYTSDLANAATDGSGNLVIRLQEVDTKTTDLVCWYGPCEYTSARLITQDRLDFEYGRIEARVKVPNGPDGLWPAFWMLGTDIQEVGWPQTGEIDIMEYVSRIPNEFFGTLHGPGYSGGASYGNTYNFSEAVSNNYHTFTIEWRPDAIDWYVDGIKFHQAKPVDLDPYEWVYNHPFFMILNTAIGGNFGGAISDRMTFPQDTLIDYVRVYQAADSSERFEATFVDDFTGWQKIHIPFEDFIRSSSQPPDAPDDGLSLSEVWGYSFMLPDGIKGSFYLDRVYIERSELIFLDGFEQNR